jgi:hypothetical protein
MSIDDTSAENLLLFDQLPKIEIIFVNSTRAEKRSISELLNEIYLLRQSLVSEKEANRRARLEMQISHAAHLATLLKLETVEKMCIAFSETVAYANSECKINRLEKELMENRRKRSEMRCQIQCLKLNLADALEKNKTLR